MSPAPKTATKESGIPKLSFSDWKRETTKVDRQAAVASWVDKYNTTMKGIADYGTQLKDGYTTDISGGYSGAVNELLHEYEGFQDSAAEFGLADGEKYYKHLQDLQGNIRSANAWYAGFAPTEEQAAEGYTAEKLYTEWSKDNNYRQKYQGKSYSEIVEAIDALQNGEEKQWLKNNANSFRTIDDIKKQLENEIAVLAKLEPYVASEQALNEYLLAGDQSDTASRLGRALLDVRAKYGISDDESIADAVARKQAEIDELDALIQEYPTMVLKALPLEELAVKVEQAKADMEDKQKLAIGSESTYGQLLNSGSGIANNFDQEQAEEDTYNAQLESLLLEGQAARNDFESALSYYEKISDIYTYRSHMERINSMTKLEKLAFEGYLVLRDEYGIREWESKLTDGQKKIIGSPLLYLEQHGYTADELKKLAETYGRYLNEENTQKTAEDARKFADDYHILPTVSAFPAKLLGAITGTASAVDLYVKDLFGQTSYHTLDPNAAGYQPQIFADTVRQAESEGMDIATRVVYNAFNSTGDNLLRVAVGGPKGALILAGMDSFSSTVREVSQNGGMPEEAIMLGLAKAGLEVLTEKASIDSFIKLDKPSDAIDLLNNLRKQGLIEVSEEELSFLGGIAAEAVILGNKSDINLRLAELERQGKNNEKAKKIVFEELFMEAAETAITSYLSGSMMGGVSEITQKNSDSKQETAVGAKPGTVEYVQELAALGAGKEAQKNADSEETTVTVKSAGSAINEGNAQKNTLAYALATNLDAIRDMEPVTKLTGREFNNRSIKLSDQIRSFFKSLGNKVFRSNLGDVELGEYGVGGVLNHRPINRAKAVSLAAVPDVIRSGRQIGYDPNWKGRGYESYIFAAPVTVGGTEVYVAAVVNKLPDNKFYLSEMVDSEGNYVRIEESPSGNSKNGLPMGLEDQQVRDYAGPEGLSREGNPSTTSAEPTPLFNNSIPETEPSVNRNSDSSSVGALSYVQELATLGQGDTVQMVDTESHAGYDNGTDAITNDEKAALLAYKGSASYPLNANLRDNLELDEEEQKIVKGLDSALGKLPVYNGVVYRNLVFDDVGGQDELDAFVKNHKGVGRIVIYNAYTSASTRQVGYPVNGKFIAHVVIESSNGRNIDGFGNNFESEVLFARNSVFAVSRIEFDANGTPTIYLKEATNEGVSADRDGNQETPSGNHRGQQEISTQSNKSKMQRLPTQGSGNSKMQVVSEWNSEGDSDEQTDLRGVQPEVEANESVGAAPAGFDPNTHLQYQYGTLPEGENAVRSDDLPVSTDGNNRVSQTAVTVKGAKVTPDEFADLLTKDVTEKNGMTYIPITNDATVQKAMDHISNEGWEAAKAQQQSETIDESGVTDGFTGMSGLSYNAEQANLLASLSTTAIQNATDLYGKKDITFNDIGISDAETRQAWIDAGLAYEETSPDGTKYIAIQSEMLMDERARRREVAKQTTVDTETQAEYDNENNQGGVVNGTGEETQTVYSGGTEGAFGIQGKTRTEASDRSGVQEILGEATERSAQTVSNQKNDRLNDKPLLYDKATHITPKTGSLLENVQRTFMQDYGIECYIIKDSAWRERDPACSRHGRVYIQESIDEATLSTAVPHESTHAMRQLGFGPYMEFFPVVQDSIISGSENGQKLLYLAGAQCGIDPLSISTDEEYYRFYSELNAIVYGLERAGIINNPNYEFAYIPSAFRNYNSYIAELDSIHEQYRQQVRAEKSAAEGQANESVGAAPAGFDPNTHLQYQYGTLPEGENAVRSDDLPVSTDGTNRVSQTAVTVKGAKVTSDEFADLLTKDVTEKNGMTYIPITNDATVQKAMDHISNEGWEAAKAQWQADVHNGKAGADMSAVGALLLNNAAKAGDKTAWLDILHDYQILGTNTAQGLQALRILKKLSPSDKLYMAKRSVQQMVKDMKLDTDVTIDPELEAEYNEAETDEQRDAVLKKIRKNVARQLPTTFMEKITALRYLNMLGNLRTQGRNIVGNLTMMGTRAIHNTVAAGIEAVVNKVSGGKTGRTRSITVNKEQLKSASKDFDDMQAIILDGRKFDDTSTTTGFARAVQDEKQIFKSKVLEGYRKVTNWAMEQGDIIFARAAYARALAGYLKANGIKETDFSKIDTEIMDDARLFAAKEAQEATFRDTNWLSGWVSKIGRRKDTPAVGKLLSEGIMPFRKTPANVLVRAEEYSPLGVINSVVMSVRAAQKGSDVTANQVINSWAKTITGTGLFGVGMLLQSLGLLSAGPDDDEKKEGFEDLNGWQDYALTLPDGTNLTIDCFSPSAIPVLMGAQLMQLIGENGFQLKDLEAALTSMADPMVEMSMLQGVNDTLENIQHADSSLGQLAINAAVSYLTQGLTNTLAGQLERSFEDVRMQTYVDKDSDLPAWLQRTLGKASAKTPVLEYNQIPYINAWGEEEKNPPTGLNLVYNLLSPSYFDKGKDDEVTRELNRLNEVQSDVNVYPSTPDKTVTINKQDYNLSAEEYVAVAKLRGQTQKQIVESLIANSDYAGLSDKDKAKAIRYAYDYARDYALGDVIEDHPGITAKWMQKISGDPAEGIIRHIAADDKYTFLSVSDASYVDDLLKGLPVESGKTNVRDIQKIEAITGADSKLSADEQKKVLEDTLTDSAFAKYQLVLDLGMDNDDYATSYRTYLDEKAVGGKGTKARIIAEFQDDLEVSKSVAEALYDIYAGKK